jgi:hypothetical protein
MALKRAGVGAALVTAGLLSALLPGASWAAPAPSAKTLGLQAADEPAPEIAPLTPLAGHWQCRGTILDENGAQVPIQSVGDASFELGGRWLVANWKDTLPSGAEQGFRMVWGWNATARKFTLHTFDSSGGFAEGSSSGFVDKTLVSEGTTRSADGTELPIRTTVSLTDSGSTTSSTVKLGDEWVTVYESTCTR